MHYYKRNIGDYHKKAGRLSMVEHGAYTLLIDACYDRERFPTRHDAIDWLWARTEEEVAAIDFVLDKFFSLQEDGTYIQSRIQEDLAAYHAMAQTNQRIAKEREAKRREASNKKKGKSAGNKGVARSVDESCESVDEAPPNQEPLTKNQEPRTNINTQDWRDEKFEEFYKIYPNKKSKGQAKITWNHVFTGNKLHDKPESPEVLFQQIIKAAKDQTAKIMSSEETFRKHPSTWLNAQAWLDEVAPQQP
ncbi:MAG: YdaU family protein, partial [Psychrobacter alimentarius]